MPRPAASENMQVVFADFLFDIAERNTRLTVGVDIRSVPDAARFLQVWFPQTDPASPPQRLTSRLDGPGEYKAESSPLSGLRNFGAYAVLVQLTADEAGTTVLEELTQNVRYKMPPMDEIPR